jgi:hypothetical protein
MTQAALGARHGSHGKGCGGGPVTVLSRNNLDQSRMMLGQIIIFRIALFLKI